MFIEKFPVEFEMEQRMIMSEEDYISWFTYYRIIGYLPVFDAPKEIARDCLVYNNQSYMMVITVYSGYIVQNPLWDMDLRRIGDISRSIIKAAKGVKVNTFNPSMLTFSGELI